MTPSPKRTWWRTALAHVLAALVPIAVCVIFFSLGPLNLSSPILRDETDTVTSRAIFFGLCSGALAAAFAYTAAWRSRSGRPLVAAWGLVLGCAVALLITLAGVGLFVAFLEPPPHGSTMANERTARQDLAQASMDTFVVTAASLALALGYGLWARNRTNPRHRVIATHLCGLAAVPSLVAAVLIIVLSHVF
ncbi:hypothetical protein GCM10027416_12370 [Okibacterium endophyticum]